MASSRLAKFLLLPWHKKRAFLTAFLTLWIYRIGLWTLPYSHIRRQASAMKTDPKIGDLSVEDIVWSVEVASKFVLKATCLTQALAAKRLLSRNGYSSDLWIGVDSGANSGADSGVDSCNTFTAHAWIERGGKVILGGPINRYKPLYILE